MGFRSLLAVAAAATAAVVSPAPLAARGEAEKIKWDDCDAIIQRPDGIKCGTLEVPLDYTNDSDDAKTLELSLAKVPAVHESKGSILFNFGGPGSPSISTLATVAPLLHNMTGGHHDLVAFDPRGTGETMTFSCFEDSDEREYFFAKYPMPLYGSSDVTAGQLWANTGTFASVCNDTVGDEGELIGTAFVARDMMKIVDALDEDGMLRYWGMSYGSILGATTAAMFPDRIDKMVLDGIANPETYYHSFHLGPDQQAGADAAWESFLGECIEAGDKCALSSLNDTASDLADTLDRAAESYRTDPVAVGGVVITYSAVRSFYYNLIKTLGNVEVMMEAIAALVAREDLEEYGPGLGTTDSAGENSSNEAIFGISCSDAIPRADSREEVMDEVEFEMASSRFGGEMPYSTMTCAQWPFEAKERKTVDEEVETKNPILIVGNTYDVATAVKSAYSLSELFPGSVVVEQKGYGHTSIAQRSECTFKTIGDYFTDGDLPDGNIECEVDTPLFGGEDTQSVSE